MWLNRLMILLLSLALTACFHTEDEDDGHDDHSHKLEGPVNSLTNTGFILDTEDGTQVTVVTNENTGGDDLTGLVVGDYVEVDGTLDPLTNSVTATKIETDSDPTDASETLIVVAAGLDKPVVELEVDDVQSSDAHVEVEGVVASVAGNAVVVDITEVEHTTADMGIQMTVMLSNDFIKLGALSDIAVGDKVELKGKLDANNNFVIQVMKVEVADDGLSDDDVKTEDDDVDADETVSDDVDDDTKVEYSIEVHATVDSVLANILTVTTMSSDDNTLAADMQMIIDIANINIFGADLAGLQAGDEVELKGEFDAAGNFVVMAVEVEDSDTEVEYSVEVYATVDSILANVLTVTTMTSDDNTVAADMQMIIDIANINIYGADLAGLQAGDKVELEGEFDAAGNFVVMAVEVESEDDDASDNTPELKGVVTQVSSTAVTVTVSGSEHMMGMMKGSMVTISIDGNTVLENGALPQVGDMVEIDVVVTPGTGNVAAMIDIKV